MNLRDVYVEALNELESGGISLEEFQRRTSILLDAEPVVRCKDCRYNEWCIPKQGRSEDDYCSRGERIEDDSYIKGEKTNTKNCK